MSVSTMLVILMQLYIKNIKLGVCESYYEKEINSVCHSELSTTADDQNCANSYRRHVRKEFYEFPK